MRKHSIHEVCEHFEEILRPRLAIIADSIQRPERLPTMIRRLTPLLLLGLLATQTLYAKPLQQETKLWLNLMSNKAISKNGKWRFSPWVYVRLFNPNHVFDQGLAQGLVGYQWTPRMITWLGFNYVPMVINATGKYTAEKRGIAQLTVALSQRGNHTFALGNRVELRIRNNEAHPAWRYRQGVVLIFPNVFKKGRGVILREQLYFNLNHPRWVNRQTINQNRFLAGVLNFSATTKRQWILGYLNQFVVRDASNAMEHYLYLEYGFV